MPAHVAELDGMTSINTSANVGAGSVGHGCYLDRNRELYCFGDNTRGQFGNGMVAAGACGNGKCDAGETSATCATDCGPPPMSRLRRTYRALSVSWGSTSTPAFTCGVRDDGQVECWGRNRNSLISTAIDPMTNAPVDTVYTPTPIGGLADCTAISAGDTFACAMCGGEIWCWGDHRRGAVGSGPVTGTPVTVPRRLETALGAGDAWAELAAGAGFACARTTAGHAYCWGANIHGALGTGAAAANLPTPLRFAR
jgi:alpha-tubulin suppressor-like RCC1 family protein